tara:strand:- start:42639 stop:43058 length:420 start_codon:yes stop_codon:yes gene_type:complete
VAPLATQSIASVTAIPPRYEDPSVRSKNSQPQQNGYTSIKQAPSVSTHDHPAFRTRLWLAYKGASLYEVASVWCEEAGVSLIWHAPRGMALKQTISEREPFANVMEQLLSQYAEPPYNLNGILSMSTEHNKPRLIVISQ